MNSNYSITHFNFDLSHLRKTKILKLSFDFDLFSKQVNTFSFFFFIQELKRHESTFTNINNTQVTSLKMSYAIVSRSDLSSKLLQTLVQKKNISNTSPFKKQHPTVTGQDWVRTARKYIIILQYKLLMQSTSKFKTKL